MPLKTNFLGLDPQPGPPPPPWNDGDIYFNSVLEMVMQYDGSRSKWLSVETATFQFGRLLLTPTGAFYRGVGGILLSATRGWTAPFHGTIVSLEYTRLDVDPTNFEVTAGGVTAATVASAATKGRDETLNGDFAQDDVLAVRNNGNTTTGVLGAFRVKWRVP